MSEGGVKTRLQGWEDALLGEDLQGHIGRDPTNSESKHPGYKQRRAGWPPHKSKAPRATKPVAPGPSPRTESTFIQSGHGSSQQVSNRECNMPLRVPQTEPPNPSSLQIGDSSLGPSWETSTVSSEGTSQALCTVLFPTHTYFPS